MKLLFLYGPPAAGKLTVANEIAERTGFRVFHNHLTIDAILPVFEFGSPSFGKLVSLIRAETIAEAARENVDLIYTFCYAKDSDDEHIARITLAVEDNGGEVCFVLLRCSVEELNNRVASQRRAEFKKIRDAETLGTILDNNDLFSTIPERESLVVDNTTLDAATAAELIIEHFGLKR
jgi:shikimate kinase